MNEPTFDLPHWDTRKNFNQSILVRSSTVREAELRVDEHIKYATEIRESETKLFTLRKLNQQIIDEGGS